MPRLINLGKDQPMGHSLRSFLQAAVSFFDFEEAASRTQSICSPVSHRFSAAKAIQLCTRLVDRVSCSQPKVPSLFELRWNVFIKAGLLWWVGTLGKSCWTLSSEVTWLSNQLEHCAVAQRGGQLAMQAAHLPESLWELLIFYQHNLPFVTLLCHSQSGSQEPFSLCNCIIYCRIIYSFSKFDLGSAKRFFVPHNAALAAWVSSIGW